MLSPALIVKTKIPAPQPEEQNALGTATVGVDFHPMGHTLATGAEDNQVKIWDLRKRKQMQSLCAHNKLVSSVKFEPEQGRYLLTSSFKKRLVLQLHVSWTKS